MKAQELVISCFYDNDGESIQDLLYSSFAGFLKKKELVALDIRPQM